MRAYELLGEMLALFQTQLPQADFRESWRPGSAGRLPGKPTVTGQVGSESASGNEWEARLDLTVFLPRGESANTGDELLAAMEDAAQAHFPSLSSVKREGFGVDKATGLLATQCFFAFAASGGTSGAQSVSIGGVERTASGWKIKIDPGRALTAVGENVPFALVGGVCYTVEIEGIDTKGLERLAAFTVEMGNQRFTRCRWKSLDETGKSAVFVSYDRTEGGG